MKKICNYLKTFFKENYKQLIFLVIFYLVMTFPLPYYIYVGGGTIDVSKRINITDSYEEKGSFNLAYVTELRGNLPTLALSYILPSWERVKITDYQLNENETATDLNNRDRIYLSDANQAAIYVAYTKAGKTFAITKHHYLVYYVDPLASDEIRVGDELQGVDDIKELDLEQLREYISNKNVGDEVTLHLIRNDKEIDVTTTIFEEDNIKYTGLAFFDIIDYTTDPKIELSFKETETGPSGGFTMALAIYNRLIEEDITAGKKIVGTGTIDFDGNIGEIGGVKYKLMGAVAKQADIFIVPNGNNYEECIKLQKEKKYKIKIIGVDNFDDAINKLSGFLNIEG